MATRLRTGPTMKAVPVPRTNSAVAQMANLSRRDQTRRAVVANLRNLAVSEPLFSSCIALIYSLIVHVRNKLQGCPDRRTPAAKKDDSCGCESSWFGCK